MINSPFFSIIIPTYNSDQTISAALYSILQQDYPNFEILIMDGCSKDNTLQIVKEYHDPRINIISEPDKGIYDAMNKGVALANGEWIYFLGSDDQLYSNDVLGKVATACKEGRDIIYGNVFSPLFKGLYDGVFDFDKILNKNICHQALFIRKLVFATIGTFNLKYRAHADWDHNMRWIFSPDLKHHFINEIIANYAAGGFSSSFIDIPFKKDRVLNYLHYSKNKLTLRKKQYILRRALVNQIKNHNYYQMIRLLYYVPRLFY